EARGGEGRRRKTAARVVKSQGVIVNENAKLTAPKREAAGEISIARSQSHIPVNARKSLSAAAKVKACDSGRIRVPMVKGENAAELPSAASAMPQPFQRLRSGSDPSFQAIRTALTHGANWVAESFKFGL